MKNNKAGFVTILGLPNSGKSSLMNSLLGQKISIITAKPQTTRKRILGILSEEDYQIIFFDTPGILKPDYLLQEKMIESIVQSIKDADVILIIVDLYSDPAGEKIMNNEIIKNVLEKNKKPKILLLNKIDLSNQAAVEKINFEFSEKKYFKKIIPVSALKNINIHSVLSSIIKFLPMHEKFYPDDIVSEENERFFVSEIIREKILELYEEEIPYSVEVLIIDFKERENGKDFIQAEIIAERESQKAIIIGKQGSAIKKLGLSAREAIEDFLQREVFLDLRVKVKEKWRKNEKYLRSFGYSKYTPK